MFSQDAIHALVDLFNQRGVMLYHACQLSHFEAYLRAGGLAPDAHLQQAAIGGVAEVHGDGKRAVPGSRSICFRLTDPGAGFARDLNNLPPIEGPIVFQLKPAALEHAAEIAICLKQRDAPGFDPDRDTLGSPGEVEHLFKYTREAPLPEKSFLKSPAEIRAAFNREDAVGPHIYCMPAAGIVPISQVASVWVDNYLIAKRQLRDWVHETQVHFDQRFSIQRRYSPADIGGLLANEIAASLLAGVPTLAEVARTGSPALRKWAQALAEKGLEQEFQAFAHSFREETLLPIITGRKTLKIAAAPGGRAPQTGLSREKRELVDKLLKEKIPFASIARITDLEETHIRDYAARKSS